MCAVQESKYTCPQCEVKTCSLKCSKIHKAELECSGQRDCTKFVPINKFTNLDLLSDYKLLEEISRLIVLCVINKYYVYTYNILALLIIHLHNYNLFL